MKKVIVLSMIAAVTGLVAYFAFSSEPILLSASETVAPVMDEIHDSETVFRNIASFPNRMLSMPLLAIPALRVKAPVVYTGLGKDGKMIVPDNYKEVGLYSFAASPGEKGSAVMGAHVDNGAAISGVFKNLKNLKKGDDIYYTNSEGKTLRFKVIARKIYPYNTQNTAEVYIGNGGAGLNLITCHGKWMPKLNTYTQRLVVFTELVS